MFEKIPACEPDAILGLNESYQRDPNESKLNLTIGVYIDEQGHTPILSCVKKAEQQILASEDTKSYLNITGNPDYCHGVRELLLGNLVNQIDQDRVTTLQTPGGTGALRVAADFIATYCQPASIWVGDPTWPNHPKIFQAAGAPWERYPYLGAEQHKVDLDAMLGALQQIPSGNFVVLHGCCHNPTGIDPTAAQWEEIAAVLGQRNLIPIIDFAYQGFGQGLESDSLGFATVANEVDELIVCSSFSKTFGLYRERTGALTIISKDKSSSKKVLDAVKLCVRRNYSNPPAHGAAIVACVLGNPQLRAEWLQELDVMSTRIRANRKMLAKAVAERGIALDLTQLQHQVGMFSLLPLTTDQVDRLRNERSIYMLRNGRINLAGLHAGNLDNLLVGLEAVSA